MIATIGHPVIRRVHDGRIMRVCHDMTVEQAQRLAICMRGRWNEYEVSILKRRMRRDAADVRGISP